MKILVVEDDPSVAQTLRLMLSGYNYAVDVVGDGEAGLQMTEAFDYDLVLLDVMLPKLDGISVCQQLRSQGFQTPILLLTGQGEGRQKAIALNAGADDYVVKPFDTEELIARIQALLRRGGPTSHPVLTWGQLSIDPGSRKVAYGTQLLAVTPKEYGILELFLRNPQKALNSKVILEHVWTSLESPGEEAVRVHIKQLRQKLAALGAPQDFIQTKHRVGYQLNRRYSNFLATQVEQQPTAPQIAELTGVNQELRQTLEELQTAEEELRQQNEQLAAAQQTLELERQRYRDLFEFAPDAYFVTDVRGVIQEANSAAAQLLHRPIPRLIGKPLIVFIAKADRRHFSLQLANFNFEQNWEVTLKPRRADAFPVLIAVTRIQNLQNQVVGLRWSLRDIRLRKQMEQQAQAAHAQLEIRVAERTAELRQREEFLSNIYDGTAQPIFVVAVTETNDFRYISFNQAAQQTTSMSLQAVQDKTPEAVFGPEVGTLFRRNYERCVQAGRSITYEDHFVFDDRPVWTLTTLAPLRNPAGRIDRIVGTVLEITERKRIETERDQGGRNLAFLAEISETLADWRSLDATMQTVSAKIGTFLKLDRCYLAEINEATDEAMVAYDWHRADLPSLASNQAYRLSDFVTEAFRQAAHREEMIVVRDTRTDPRTHHESCAALNIQALISSPCVQNGQLQFLLCGTHSTPRDWRNDEIELLRELTTRIWIRLEHARAEAALRRSEERFRTSVENMLDCFGVYQAIRNEQNQIVDFRVEYVNDAACRNNHMTREQQLGQGLCELLPGHRDSELFVEYCRVVETGQPLIKDSLVYTDEYGQQRLVRAFDIRIAKFGDGFVATWRDVTDRRLTEQKIQEQAALLDVTSDAIFVQTLTHHIVYWNQGAERLYGWMAAEAIDQAADQLLGSQTTHRSEIMETLGSQGEWRGEMQKVTKSGKQVIVDTCWTLVRDEAGQPKSILCVDTDITEKKQLEAQFYHAQRLESLGTLASGIAHDLNNVLTPILAITQLMRLSQPYPDARSQEMLRVLEDSAKRGANLIKQILTFTRGTGGERTPLELVPLLQEVITVIQQTFPRSITIRQIIPEHGHGLVSANSTQLHQVFMNLCVNARDAMPDGGTLTFAVEKFEGDLAFAQANLDAQVGHYVVVTIGDTGTGISPEVRDRIFDPFFTTKALGRGTGLGLATVLGIVRNYGGFVRVFSEVGRGTQMKVYLPTIAEGPTQASQPEQPLDGNGELVLLVDDDPAVRQSTQSLLESHHYTVLSTHEGAEAIALYTQRQDDIRAVILDIMMPNMSGIVLIQRLQAINPNVKIIAMSGLPANQEPAIAAGASAFLSKPYILEDLLRTLQTLITADNA